ncbi:hypothetical protein HK096_011170 [Nowakowskiella sp. JEL0078]|nr:hypothetical protein HK096_011170 [Nowakowskiella sp. JEL0078]
MYLGLNGKTSSIGMHSDDLIIMIQMPLTKKIENIQMEITEEELNLKTIDYKLMIPLPKPVENNLAVAKWDGSKHELVVEMPTKKMTV